ncbi:unnamed protein product [Paramecium primaurelia]|uniref:TLDc domain-containing protein n=1 Tax=Paramecium primaurelia TaxID=5886 RepID=A0A8S1NZD7_PARPR|nr:unnamed protein product [Paramecium primaurelia]
MVFKSKSDYIFGAYSPCKWESCNGKYIEDNTLSSFIFSQTHDQVYPLKQDQKQYAIYCHSSVGPRFGQGHDIQINSDFTDGNSRLGCLYQFNQYKNQNDDPYLYRKQLANWNQILFRPLNYHDRIHNKLIIQMSLKDYYFFLSLLDELNYKICIKVYIIQKNTIMQIQIQIKFGDHQELKLQYFQAYGNEILKSQLFLDALQILEKDMQDVKTLTKSAEKIKSEPDKRTKLKNLLKAGILEPLSTEK